MARPRVDWAARRGASCSHRTDMASDHDVNRDLQRQRVDGKRKPAPRAVRHPTAELDRGPDRGGAEAIRTWPGQRNDRVSSRRKRWSRPSSPGLKLRFFTSITWYCAKIEYRFQKR